MRDYQKVTSVDSYEEALSWLWQFSRPAEWMDAETLPLEAKLICAIYWRSEDHLRRDLAKQWRSTFDIVRAVKQHGEKSW